MDINLFHVNDSQLNKKSKAVSWDVSTTRYYTQFRIKMTGPNDSDRWYLCC